MPLYEYDCPSCDANYDRLKPHGKRDDEACRNCGEPAVRRQSAIAGMVRGAGGWSSPKPRAPQGGGVMRRTDSRGIAKNMTPAEINSLPVVGRDGQLYTPDGKKNITPSTP